MKTAISVPNEVFERIEKYAKKKKMSRSQVFSKAAEEYLDKVFKMFFRANADSKGSGLGLYIVKSALEKLGGTIEVQSMLGQGSTFTLTVPNLRARNN